MLLSFSFRSIFVSTSRTVVGTERRGTLAVYSLSSRGRLLAQSRSRICAPAEDRKAHVRYLSRNSNDIKRAPGLWRALDKSVRCIDFSNVQILVDHRAAIFRSLLPSAAAGLAGRARSSNDHTIHSYIFENAIARNSDNAKENGGERERGVRERENVLHVLHTYTRTYTRIYIIPMPNRRNDYCTKEYLATTNARARHYRFLKRICT